MKNLLILSAFVWIAWSCQPPCEQQYFTDSPEIQSGKKLVDAYLAGDWDAYPSFYADTAKIWRNTNWNSTDGMSPSELVTSLQDGLNGVSAYSFDSQVWEMIVNDNGAKWVHFWGVWKGTMEANGKTYEIPVHLSMNFVEGKIALQGDIFNNTEVTLDMQALQAAAAAAEAEDDSSE